MEWMPKDLSGGIGEGALIIRYRAILLAAVFMLTLAGTIRAVPCVDYSRMGHWVGTTLLPVETSDDEPGVVLVNGDVLYVTGSVYSNWSDRLYAIDAADATAPAVTDSLDLYMTDLVLQGDYLYIASLNQRLNIVSVADPRHPVLVSHLDLGQRAHYVRVHGDRAYLGSEFDPSAVVVDISDPSHPIELGALVQDWGIRTLSFSGAFGYVAADGDVVVLDLSDPLHPAPLSRLDESDDLYDLTVSDNICAAIGVSSIHLFDLADPARPAKVSSFGPSLSGTDQQVKIAGGLLCQEYREGAIVWDISRPDQPRRLGWIGQLDRFKAAGLGPDRIYVVEAPSSFVVTVAVMDFSSRQLADPEMGFAILDDAASFVITGDLLIAGSDSEVMSVYGLEDSAMPVRRGALPLEPNRWLVDANGHLVAAAGYGSVRLVDVSDPDAPRARGLITFTGRYIGARLHGDRACITSGDNQGVLTVSVFDIADPDHPVALGGIETYVSGSDPLIFTGDLAIVSSYVGFSIFDFTAATGPHLASTTESFGASGIGLRGTDLYVGLGNGGFAVYDISDPTAPRLKGSQRTLGLTTDFAFDGDLVYVHDLLCGWQVVDTRDPAAPQWIATLLNPYQSGGRIHGGLIYFKEGGRVVALPLQCVDAASVNPEAPSPATLNAEVHPNPFNPSTTVAFDLEVGRPVRITVHDVAGRRVATVTNDDLAAGHHMLRWDGRSSDGRSAPSGIYFFAIETDVSRQVLKAALLK